MSPEEVRLEALRLAVLVQPATPAEVTARAEEYRNFLAGPEITVKEVVKEVLIDMVSGKVVGTRNPDDAPKEDKP